MGCGTSHLYCTFGDYLSLPLLQILPATCTPTNQHSAQPFYQVIIRCVKRGCVALNVQSSGDPLAVLWDGIQLSPHLLAQKPNDMCPHSQISEDQAFPRIPVLHRTAVLCSLSSQTYGPLHRGARRVCGNGCSRLDCYDGGTREGPSSLTRIEGPSAWILRVPLRLAVPGDPRHCHILRS